MWKRLRNGAFPEWSWCYLPLHLLFRTLLHIALTVVSSSTEFKNIHLVPGKELYHGQHAKTIKHSGIEQMKKKINFLVWKAPRKEVPDYPIPLLFKTQIWMHLRSPVTWDSELTSVPLQEMVSGPPSPVISPHSSLTSPNTHRPSFLVFTSCMPLCIFSILPLLSTQICSLSLATESSLC